MSMHHDRYIVIGTTGSGKSTLAERLSQKLGLEYIELDALFWRPNWSPVGKEEFRSLVELATQAPRWAVAGNYSQSRDIAWPRATAIIWLDYSFWTIFWRLTFRTFRRNWRRELLWGTNYESLGRQFKLWSDESIWRWFFKTYWRRKKEIPQFLAQSENRHLTVFHFRTVAETERWFAGLR